MKPLINDLLLIFAISIGNINMTMGQDINLANTSKMDINFISGGFLIKGWVFTPADSAHKKPLIKLVNPKSLYTLKVIIFPLTWKTYQKQAGWPLNGLN